MIGDDFGDSKVTVKKGDLLDVVIGNRTKHIAEFAETDRKYRAALVTALEGLLETARTGVDCPHGVKLDKPESHEGDYDRVIRMLQMCVPDLVTISETQFRQYVQDEWSWSNQFKNVSASYAAGRR